MNLVTVFRYFERLSLPVEKDEIFAAFKKGSSQLREKKYNQNADADHQFGVGLGLTIVKRFIELHQGTIQVKIFPELKSLNKEAFFDELKDHFYHHIFE